MKPNNRDGINIKNKEKRLPEINGLWEKNKYK